MFCFSIYDLNGDGFISKEEMITMLKSCLVSGGAAVEEEDGEDGVKVCADMFTLFQMYLLGLGGNDPEEDGP